MRLLELFLRNAIRVIRVMQEEFFFIYAMVSFKKEIVLRSHYETMEAMLYALD